MLSQGQHGLQTLIFDLSLCTESMYSQIHARTVKKVTYLFSSDPRANMYVLTALTLLARVTISRHFGTIPHRHKPSSGGATGASWGRIHASLRAGTVSVYPADSMDRAGCASPLPTCRHRPLGPLTCEFVELTFTYFRAIPPPGGRMQRLMVTVAIPTTWQHPMAALRVLPLPMPPLNTAISSHFHEM